MISCYFRTNLNKSQISSLFLGTKYTKSMAPPLPWRPSVCSRTMHTVLIPELRFLEVNLLPILNRLTSSEDDNSLVGDLEPNLCGVTQLRGPSIKIWRRCDAVHVRQDGTVPSGEFRRSRFTHLGCPGICKSAADRSAADHISSADKWFAFRDLLLDSLLCP